MNKVLIVGYGIVGHNLKKELAALNPDVYDKYKPAENTKQPGVMYDIAYICVDTPYVNKGNVCDISQVRAAISENEAKLYVIKSTVLPGTTESLSTETGKNIAFSPEYYGSTHFTNNYVFDFTIIGGDSFAQNTLTQALQHVYDGRHKFIYVDAKTAELCKYMENAYLAMKVSFSQQFFEIARDAGVDYEKLRECFVADPRIDPANTYVFRDHPWWSSHCYNKDVPAIAETYKAPLLLAMIDFNESQKHKYE